MDSLIPITLYHRQNHRVHTYRAGTGGSLGVLRRDGEYYFMHCRGAIRREDVPAGAQPVKLLLEAWSPGAGEQFVSERNYVDGDHHVVGVRIGHETYVVFYDGHHREVPPAPWWRSR